MTIQFPNFNYNAVLCRYGELTLKGGNRNRFEQQLAANIKKTLPPAINIKCSRIDGRLVLLPQQADTFTSGEIYTILRKITYIFGLVSASPAFSVPSAKETIEQVVFNNFPTLYNTLKDEHCSHHPVRYAARVRRSTNSFPLTSTELEIEIADKLLSQFDNLKVDLEDPEIKINIEIRGGQSLITFENVNCPGGLPGGTGGRVLGLLSGGIDSPVACYEMMRRGHLMDFITYHSHPYTPPATERKVKRLADTLNSYQEPGSLYSANLLNAQKKIREKVSPDIRTIIYRRLMLRIAEELAENVDCQALVTGDNIGQVASQTLENLTVIADAVQIPIFRPLLTNDKQETIRLARHIDTYEISREDVPDSCTVFVSGSPATKTTSEKVHDVEKELDLEELKKECLDNADKFD